MAEIGGGWRRWVAAFWLCAACGLGTAAEEVVNLPVSALRLEAGDGQPLAVEPGPARAGEPSALVTVTPEAPVLANSGLLAVNPGQRYKVRVHLLAARAGEDAQVDLLVRQHEAAEGRPLQPYGRIGVDDRPLRAEPETWRSRQLMIETGERTRFLSFTLVLSGTATVAVGGAELTPGPIEAAAVAALMAECRALAATRQRVTDRLYFMPRSQLKYGWERNYLHWWFDRPLQMDTSLRADPANVYRLNPATFALEIAAAKLYGIDGFAALVAGDGQLQNYLLATRAAETAAPGFLVYPEYYGSGADLPDYLERYATALERALASPASFRVGGKVVITSYIGDGATPEQWQTMLDALRQRFGATFLFVADMRKGTPVHAWQHGLLTVEDIEGERARLRRYLDVCDGIMFMGANHIKLYYTDPDYGDSVNVDFLGNYLAPLMGSVLAEAPYRGKLFGFSAAVAYSNPRSADCKRDDRTRTLRGTFEVALAARPDFIGVPEWNEFNENTCLMPTLYRGRSSQRIIRHYLQRERGEALSPNPGDDTGLPNLIVSYRREAKLGERVFIELLNVPDGTTGDYEVRLAGGQSYRFLRERLEEQTIEIPTETAPEERALVPPLAIHQPGRDPFALAPGLPPIRLRGTWNWLFLDAKQPVRDLARPARAEFAAAGRVMTGRYEGDEPLASLEIVADGQEVFAIDPRNEFDRSRDVVLKLSLISYRGQPFAGTVRVRGAAAIQARPDGQDNLGVSNAEPVSSFAVAGNEVRLSGYVTRAWRGLLLTVPREAVAAGVLEAEFDVGTLRVPLADLAANGVFVKVQPERVVIRAEVCELLPDLPVPPGQPGASFRYELPASLGAAVCWLRAVTRSGRVYRSLPVTVGLPADAVAATIPVWSDTADAPVEVTVAADRVLDLAYEFDPRCGDLLPCAAGRRWYAELGGGLEYGLPFNRGGGFPAKPARTAPAWEQADGQWCLRFDGLGTHLTLPHEALPRGAYRLTMQARLDDASQPQLLIRSFGHTAGPLMVKVRDGKLVAASIDDRLGTHLLETGLTVPSGEWFELEVRCDLREIRLRLNEQWSAPLAFEGQCYHVAPAVIGGQNRPGFGVAADDAYLKGWVRALRIVHAPGEPGPEAAKAEN